MVEVKGTSDGVTIQGYVGKPTANRGSRSYQHFFVNGRYVKSKMMAAALEEAYKNQMMVGRFPICVLHISVAPEAVDVNVHPAKTEVKFLREGDVFDAIHYTVLGTLNRTPDRPEMAVPKQKASAQGSFYQKMGTQQYRAIQEKRTMNQAERTASKEFMDVLAQKSERPNTNKVVVRDSVRLAPAPGGRRNSFTCIESGRENSKFLGKRAVTADSNGVGNGGGTGTDERRIAASASAQSSGAAATGKCDKKYGDSLLSYHWTDHGYIYYCRARGQPVAV